MYLYDDFDRTLLAERVDEFRGQVARRLSGELTEDEFKSLRLMNGVYLQLHAYMLRIAIPYGTLSSEQLRQLAHVARRYRPRLRPLHHAPEHPVQLDQARRTARRHGGSCGSRPARHADERQLRAQYHHRSMGRRRARRDRRPARVGRTTAPAPDAASGILVPAAQVQDRGQRGSHDRAAVAIHDLSLRLHRNGAGEVGFEVMVGGGLGRTPFLAKTIKPFLAKRDVLSYVEAVLRLYNQYGRRDNIYKARIKILVHDKGAEPFGKEVEAEWQTIKDGALALDPAVIADIAARFSYPDYEPLADNPPELVAARKADAAFAAWFDNSVTNHNVPGYAIVTLSLKPIGKPPGDCTADQMDEIADIADRYSFGEIRVGHEQNLVLPHVAQRDLPEVWRALDAIGVATPNVGLVSDIIACPGLDYCSLANARAIPVAQEISKRFRDLDVARELGRLHVNISGCINACGHHHVGHIGILGVEKNGEEFYQITIGGRADEKAQLGALIGPAVPYDDVADVVEDIAEAYLDLREQSDELFIDTVKRVGVEPFKERVYATR